MIQLACLPKQYHQFILPSVRRVYLDLPAFSALQAKLETAEARLKVHKSNEKVLSDRCESLSAALEAHRVGESEAVEIIREEMATLVEDREQEMAHHNARYQQLDEEHQALQSKFFKLKRRCEQLNEQ